MCIRDRKEGFRVDFDALLEVNPDTVGWIRFYPEPSQINYPIVQGQDNDEYLHQTFLSLIHISGLSATPAAG